MWHEARKMEKKLWTIMVDHKKRAERRREYYEKIKLDPNQFLQVHGRRCKIHLDPAIAAAAEAPATMMPWQGQKDNLIDRFDGRAHLDIIPEVVPVEEKLNPEEAKEHRNANYERYRILVQNDFLKISEEKFLRTIQLEEQFGGKTYQQVKSKEDKKKSEKNKAAIGFIYEDSTEYHTPMHEVGRGNDPGSSGDSDSDSEMDLDLAVDIMALTEESRQEINTVGKTYSLGKQDFIKYLARDIEEAQELRLAKENEDGKNVTSGRKGRRERRMLREQKLKGRKISPPSYATRESPSYSDYNRSRSSTRSPSPVNAGKIEFITSFGAESDDDDKRISEHVGPTVGSSINLKKLRNNEREEDVLGRRTGTVFGPSFGDSSSDAKKSRYKSRSRSASRSKQHNQSTNRHRDRNRSRSRSRGRRSKDRSRSRSSVRRYRSRSRSHGRNNRSRSRGARNRSRSKSYGARNRSRSRSYGPKNRGRNARSSKQCSSRKDRSSSRSSSESKSKRRSLSRENPSSKRKRANSSSSSSSSSSDENDANDSTKYRSKYRNRPRSSSSSSADGKSASSRSEKSDDEAPSRLPPKPIRRYYGRAGVKKSDSEISDLEMEEPTREATMKVTPKVVTKQSLGTPQVDQVKEKIRRKMQAQIRKQFKADKKAEEEKRQREEENRITREEELREIALKMRRRDRRDSRSSSSSSPHRRSPERNGSSRKSGRRSSRSPRERSRSEKYSSRRSRSRSRSDSRDRSSSSPQRHGKLVAY